MFGRRKSFPIPRILPTTCTNCGKALHWTAVTLHDPAIGIEKVDHYKAECVCGEVYHRDGRGQVVEPAVENLAPDKSDYANSPQGPQPYSGYLEFVAQERAKEAAFKQAQAAKATAAAGGAGTESGGEQPPVATATAPEAPDEPTAG